ncbi:hypothetical protein KC669_00415 [Candidatus Dojkabacteria bacterium]|uniref:Uncharacterized protein n=1 Tax=Candidatus Dojkabacteria bacterium TaxID=2099670 RepID=A0A955L993_9BACT|nr:hypothetical protein [Candidatus Dojkabacteria bacterium]
MTNNMDSSLMIAPFKDALDESLIDSFVNSPIECNDLPQDFDKALFSRAISQGLKGLNKVRELELPTFDQVKTKGTYGLVLLTILTGIVTAVGDRNDSLLPKSGDDVLGKISNYDEPQANEGSAVLLDKVLTRLESNIEEGLIQVHPESQISMDTLRLIFAQMSWNRDLVLESAYFQKGITGITEGEPERVVLYPVTGAKPTLTENDNRGAIGDTDLPEGVLALLQYRLAPESGRATPINMGESGTYKSGPIVLIWRISGGEMVLNIQASGIFEVNGQNTGKTVNSSIMFINSSQFNDLPTIALEPTSSTSVDRDGPRTASSGDQRR